ncbi:TetR/AcrR family transcriptional regulator [Deminuibacter soli]|uniref:TetR/AcrR family transcriptional regulator n=1 Tax=Deminuibacter soli TaxID=2291815 RepID=A0A3E1NGD2_9BACT|nr:TetR/AcrR family transcriptional regulator [Deminuibacter soli]RFM27009.1 TetR/AcrR family transcriptional regulator [Deminuibacter soli]
MKPRDENKIAQVYKATLKLVKARGLAGITMQSVAKEAEMATGTLYIYFKNKDAIIFNLFHVCVQNSAQVFFRNYNPSAPYKEALHLIWYNIMRHRMEHFDESVFLEQCFHSPFIDEPTKVRVKKMFDPLRELIERGKQEQELKDMDSFWLLSFMMGSINEVVKRAVYFNKKISDEMLEMNFMMCWDGMKA